MQGYNFTVNNYVTKCANKNNVYYYIYEYIKENYNERDIHISGRYSDNFFKAIALHNNFQIDFGSIRYTDGIKQWVQLHLTQAWSLINKANSLYSNDEWVSIFNWCVSPDEASRNLAFSMLKNASYLDALLVSLALVLLSKYETKENPLFNTIAELYNCSNIRNKDINLDLMVSYVRNMTESRHDIFNDETVLNIFTRKYKGVLNIGQITVKKMSQSTLSKDQIEFACKMFSEWVKIKEENKQYCSLSDIEHSSLLRRLLSGLPPHENPPPKRYGYPAWELVEKDQVEIQNMSFYLDVGGESKVVIDQDNGYEWVDKENKIIKYTRLNLYFQIIWKEVIPNPELCAVAYRSCPEKLKYTAMFLKRIGDPNGPSPMY